MASIKGVTLKGVVRFKGHEGEPCSEGKIYLNGKKVGCYKDSYMMGPRDIDFDSKEDEAEVESVCREYYAERPGERWFEDKEPDIDEFLCKLYALVDNEKFFKKCIKQGFPILAVYEEQHECEQLMGCKTVEYAKMKIEHNKKIVRYKIYSSLAELDIK